jgi:hypothetical protein
MSNFVISMRYVYFILLVISIVCAIVGFYKLGEAVSSEPDSKPPTNYIVLTVVSMVFTVGLLIMLLTTPPNCDNIEDYVSSGGGNYRPDIPYYPTTNMNQPRASMPFQPELEMDKPTFVEKYAPMLMEHGPAILKELNPKWSQKLAKFAKNIL